MPPAVTLTIAGFDPSSGAGVTADLAVFAAHGLYGTACITAMTVQSTRGVRSVQPASAKLVHETIQELEADLPAAGVKVGMLATEEIVRTVADALSQMRARRPLFVVVDPVLISSSGHPLLPTAAFQSLRDRLLPLADCVTPNRAELSALLGRPIPDGREAIEAGAAELQRRVATHFNVIVTGGDRSSPDDLLLTTDGSSQWLPGYRIQTSSTHGTGCAFSSALLAGLVQGSKVAEGTLRAKRYLEGALRNAPGIGGGHGPLGHHWTDHRGGS